MPRIPVDKVIRTLTASQEDKAQRALAERVKQGGRVPDWDLPPIAIRREDTGLPLETSPNDTGYNKNYYGLLKERAPDKHRKLVDKNSARAMDKYRADPQAAHERDALAYQRRASQRLEERRAAGSSEGTGGAAEVFDRELVGDTVEDPRLQRDRDRYYENKDAILKQQADYRARKASKGD